MDYESLNKEDFDAIVTGELTHFALWFEDHLSRLISAYFSRQDRKKQFHRILLDRNGMTFQDKIDIVRCMAELPDLKAITQSISLPWILSQIEKFKSHRNALAHGSDVSSNDGAPHLRVEIVNRSGKEVVYEVTPKTHRETLRKAEELMSSMSRAMGKLHRKMHTNS